MRGGSLAGQRMSGVQVQDGHCHGVGMSQYSIEGNTCSGRHGLLTRGRLL